jgi:hypothetical protein
MSRFPFLIPIRKSGGLPIPNCPILRLSLFEAHRRCPKQGIRRIFAILFSPLAQPVKNSGQAYSREGATVNKAPALAFHPVQDSMEALDSGFPVLIMLSQPF